MEPHTTDVTADAGDASTDGPTQQLPRAEVRGVEPGGRVTAAAGALAAVVATAALWVGAEQGVAVYAGVVLVVQFGLVAAWCVSARPPAVAGVAAVGLLAAAGADAVALWSSRASAGPMAGVVAGAFAATILVQLARGVARRNVTEAFGATMTVVVAVTAFATTISLHRRDGVGLLIAFLLASGIGIAVARSTDLAIPHPAVHEAVPRGIAGLIAGGIAGGAVAALSATLGEPLSVWFAGLAGWGVATTAVLTDLAVAYARTGRVLAGDDPPHSAVRLVLGPLLGLAVAAPAGYVFGLALLT